MLRGKEGWPIRTLKPEFPNNAVLMHCDAAGGSIGSKNGFGGIVWLQTVERPWVMGTWVDKIQKNERMHWGKEFGKDMSVLEAAAILACLTACRKWLRGRTVLNICDNAGTVWGWKKGRSNNLFLYTILKAITEVAQGLDINLRLEHANRMTSAGDRVADALSKGDMQRAKKEWGRTRPKPEKVPETVLAWTRQPSISRTLSQDILKEIKELDGEQSVILGPETGVNYSDSDWSKVRDWFMNERKKEQTKHVKQNMKRRAEEVAEAIEIRKKTKWWTDGSF